MLSAVLRQWVDLSMILSLLFLNALVGLLSEARSESAIAALQSTLALRCRVLREGHLRETEARELVPGDVILLRGGDVVGADALLLPRLSKADCWRGLHIDHGRVRFDIDKAQGEADEADVALSVDQSALTGESLPVTKRPGDLLISSSLVRSGQGSALVVHTGARTFVGRAAHLLAVARGPGHFQRLVQRIGYALIVTTLLMVAALFAAGTLLLHHSAVHQLRDCLVITIASIPVAMPTVLSVTMAVGAQEMARRKVVVKRLTAVEELAAMDMLCCDKTGTLTENRLSVDSPHLCEGRSEEELLAHAFLATESATSDAIDHCLRAAALQRVPELQGREEGDDEDVPGHRLLEHCPFNSTSKMAYSTLRRTEDGRVITVMKGAPRVVFDRCEMTDAERRAAEKATEAMAKRGLRALAVAVSEPYDQRMSLQEMRFHCLGCIALLDPPRADSAHTIRRLCDMGVRLKMITGDTRLIAREVAKRLGLHPFILSPDVLRRAQSDPSVAVQQLVRLMEMADGWAETVPEDKYDIVQILQRGGHVVGMTGDGVNDAPALKRADVGIAVHGCTDAARSAAAIVLLEPGLAAIADGVVTSRAIFQRMRAYTLYRVSSTVHFLMFFFISILAFDFTLSAVLIVLIAVMNDISSLVIAYDRPQISRGPEKWRLGQLLLLSFVFGSLLTLTSLASYAVGRYALHYSPAQLSTLLFLQLSAFPHSLILSTRLPGPWWSAAPPPLFLALTLGTTVVVALLCGFGAFSARIGWGVTAVVVVCSVLFVAVVDPIKVCVYQNWTAMHECVESVGRKGEARRAERRRQALIHRVVRKVKAVQHALYFLHLISRAQRERHQEEERVKREEEKRDEDNEMSTSGSSDDSGGGGDLEMVSLDDAAAYRRVDSD